MRFGNFIILTGTIVIVITLISLFSLFIKSKLSNPYLKLFWFTIIGLFLSINSIVYTFFHIPEKNVFLLVQQLLAITQLTILGGFFFDELKKLFHIKLFFIAAIILSVFIIYRNYSTNYTHNFKHVNVFFNFPLIILSIKYYRSLLKQEPLQNLTHLPIFWVATGTFLYSCTSIPVYSLVNFIQPTDENKILINDLYHISNISLILLYVCFIKAYLCLKHHLNS